MLRNMNDLKGYAIRATDGDIGHLTDFYFDDKTWVIRYLIVDTGSWLLSRKVLISPISIGHPNRTDKAFPVAITMEQVKNSPDIDTDKPVSRQHEIEYLGYYDYPFYWGGLGLWAGDAYPNLMISDRAGLAVQPNLLEPEAALAAERAKADSHQNDDIHLRSCKELMRYHIEATDGEIGHVQGILVDEETWAIRYLIVNTSNWWLGHQVLIAPQWIEEVRWDDNTVAINLSRQAVQDAPPYDSSRQLERAQEAEIYEHYERSVYWED